MKAHSPTTEDDDHIPTPVWFAYQLGWASGPQGQWSWKQLVDTAARKFHANKPRQETTRAV
jgi:hypothetical protein